MYAKPVYFRTRAAGDLRCTPNTRPNRGSFAEPEVGDPIHGVEATSIGAVTPQQLSAGIREIMRHVVGKTYGEWLRYPNLIEL